MEELNNAFSTYMKEVKKLPVEQKRDEIIDSLKEILVYLEELSNYDEIRLQYLKSNEILDIKDLKKVSEDDYLEAVLVYVEEVRTLLGQYLEGINK